MSRDEMKEIIKEWFNDSADTVMQYGGNPWGYVDENTPKLEEILRFIDDY